MAEHSPSSSEVEAAGEGLHRHVPLGVVIVGMSVVVWWPSFTFAVWGTLFFEQGLTLWVASTAAFVVVMFADRQHILRRALRGAVLLLPSAALVLMFLISGTSEPAEAIVDGIALLLVIIGLPFTLWVLANIVWPELRHDLGRGHRWMIVLVVGGIAVLSFLLGLNQERFLTCEDFAISGNSEPADCTPDPFLD